MKHYALCIGINDYVGTNNDLSGCVNDANDWGDLLTSRGYQVTRMFNQDATRGNIEAALREHVSKLRYRDRLVIQYSGHGSWVPDSSGDEEDGRDEVWVSADLKYLTDDTLNEILRSRAYGTRVSMFSDSCFSGTVNKFFAPAERADNWDAQSVRFLTPTFLDVSEEQVERLQDVPARALGARNNGILFSGCDDGEFSYDAYINGRFNGAFTRTALNTFEDGMTPRQWHDAIRSFLPSSQYRQTPQLQGTWYQRNRWTAMLE